MLFIDTVRRPDSRALLIAGSSSPGIARQVTAPMTMPVIAIPFPRSTPPLLLICVRLMMPRMSAGMPVTQQPTNDNNPSTRLAIASPLVLGVSWGCGEL